MTRTVMVISLLLWALTAQAQYPATYGYVDGYEVLPSGYGYPAVSRVVSAQQYRTSPGYPATSECGPEGCPTIGAGITIGRTQVGAGVSRGPQLGVPQLPGSVGAAPSQPARQVLPAAPQQQSVVPVPVVSTPSPPSPGYSRAEAVQPHASVVRIQIQDADGGSLWGTGVVLRSKGAAAWVVTTTRLIPNGGSLKVIADGHRYDAAIVSGPKEDLVLLEMQNPWVPTLLYRSRLPAKGETVFVGGWGSDSPQFVWQNGPVTGHYEDNKSFSVGASVRKADGGGPALDKDGFVVGVISYSDEKETGVVSASVFEELLDEIEDAWVDSPVDLKPLESRVSGLERAREEILKTLEESGKRLVPIGWKEEVDTKLSQLQQGVSDNRDQIEHLESRTPPEGFCVQITQQFTSLESRTKEIEQWIAEYESQGKPVTPPTPPQPDLLSHLVLVRDTTADYWPRLSEELKRAKGHYSAIRESDPPDFATPLPALVIFNKAGVPIHKYEGARDVSTVLTQIARDEFAPVQKAKALVLQNQSPVD